MNEKKNILLIDDSRKFAFQLQVMLFTSSQTGWVELAANLEEAREVLDRNDTHVLIAGFATYDQQIVDFLKRVKKEQPGACLILLTTGEREKTTGASVGADHVIDKALAFQEIPGIIWPDRSRKPLEKADNKVI